MSMHAPDASPARAPRRRNGFTLIELLVVVAIIGLLISILLPSLSAAKEEARKAVCGSNLRQMGTACHTYATEDEKDLLVPVHLSYQSPLSRFGWGSDPQWYARLALPFSFGGRTPSRTIPIPGTNVQEMIRRPEYWGPNTRPMNIQLYGANFNTDDPNNGVTADLPLFHCPSDRGYPNSNWVQDAPATAFDIPLYEMLGNSYRLNTAGVFFITPYSGMFTSGPFGHPLSSLVNASNVVVMAEPMFYNFSRPSAQFQPDLAEITGWHKKTMQENVLFVDGSARLTRCDDVTELDDASLQQINYTDWNGGRNWQQFMRRGATWQTDAWPAPGARVPILSRTGVDTGTTPRPGASGWPFNGYFDVLKGN